MNKGGLIMLSGPSCVGKGPLCQALKNYYPQLEKSLQKLVLYNSRQPRPGEIEGVDYYFRSRQEMEALSKKSSFILLDVRGDLQGLDLNNLQLMLDKGGSTFFEGNPFIPVALWKLPVLHHFPMFRIFLSPLSRDEVIWLKARAVNLNQMVIDVMRRKLLRRTQRQKGIVSLSDLQDIEKRAQSAPLEMSLAWQFDWVIPNHDGEDSENWNAFYYPVGDAWKALQCLALLLENGRAEEAERWERDLWPDEHEACPT